MSNNFIQREIGNVIREAYKYFSVITLTGPRQSGKTTLIRNMFPEMPHCSLEDLDVRSFAINDPIAFLNQYEDCVFLDEVHKAPDLLSYIQGIVDEHPQRRFILSGSSHFAMLRNISQSLAGRSGVFELLPMSYSEVREIADKKSLDQFLYDGLFPAIYADRNSPKFLYPSYVKTYLEKDVRDLLNIKDMLQFNTFIRLCAGRIGSVFNATELSNEVGVDAKTIFSWLSVLQASYIITLLPPYFENTRKRLIKSPKLYFTDTGLACYLLNIESPEQLARDKMKGALFENFIVMEALKKRYNQGLASNIYFYRDSNQNEVDLLIRKGDTLQGVEVKSSMTYNTSFEKALLKLDEWVKPEISDKTIVYSGLMENEKSKVKLINYKRFDAFIK